MPKKFYDIIPPKGIESFSEKLELKKEIRQPKERGRKPKRIFLKGLICCAVFLILLGVAGFYIFSKVEIKIWPKTDILNSKETVIIDSEITEPNFEAKIIPGKIFSDEKSTSEEFPASGKVLKEEKARGVIRVYNAASTSSRTLIPSRFVSADGKLFWSVNRAIIPGGRYEKGKLIPGEIDVDVQAAQAGEDYNIGPSTFALPALAGSASYTTIYGKSFSAMTGGSRKEVSQVTKEDLEKAENTLIERLKKESRDFLKTSLPTDFVLLDEAISQEIVETNSSVQALTEAQSFNFQVKIKSEGVGFKKSDIENFAKNVIILNIPEGKKIHEESLEINYSLLNLPSPTFPKKVELGLEIKAKVYSDIDLTELKKALLGKSFKESKIFLENLPEVTKTEIKSWPLLRKIIPENIEKVEIKLRLD